MSGTILFYFFVKLYFNNHINGNNIIINIITDGEQINSRFDLTFYYYLVSYYTNCV